MPIAPAKFLICERFGLLAASGGDTPTCLLQTGSPALDAIPISNP
jgi:hypothetical protein